MPLTVLVTVIVFGTIFVTVTVCVTVAGRCNSPALPEASIAFWRLVGRFPRPALEGDVTWNGRMNLPGPAFPSR